MSTLKKSGRRQIERRYIAEAVPRFWKHRRRVYLNKRIGKPPEELTKLYPNAKITAFSRWQVYPDAIVVTDRSLVIVEAKIYKPIDALGALCYYAEVVYDTPDLQRYKGLPVEKVLICPMPSPELVKAAGRMGVQVIGWMPDWVADYLRSVGWLV